MKQIIFIGIFFFITTNPVEALNYHTPEDIINILNDSKIEYQIQPFKADNRNKPEMKMIQHGIFLKQQQNGFVITDYATEIGENPQYTELLTKAEDAFHKGDMSEAQKTYKEILRIYPENSQIMTYLGQAYSNDNNAAEAAVYYRKAIKSNYLDYMAHWFLADLLYDDGKIKEAVQEITVAHLLNRNNPRIQVSLKKIYKADQRQWCEWEFLPCCTLEAISKGKVAVKVDTKSTEWLAYALCKAVWQFEPGYRKSMLADVQEFPLVVEERECLFNFIAAKKLKEKQDTNDDIAIKMLMAAVEQKELESYIIYEIVLREDPTFSFYLNPTNIKPVVDYLTDFRAPVKMAEKDV